MFILWLCLLLSSFLGPYIDVASQYRWIMVGWERDHIDNIFLLYFAAVLLIDSEKKMKYMTVVLVLSTIYLIYWCNQQYLAHIQIGRIAGPNGPEGGDPYADQNMFAMLFVIGLPFLYYFGLYFKKKIIRFALWLIMPFGWHAIFLTGSRGGLLGLGVTLLVIAFRSSRKTVGLGLILLFVAAFLWQGGNIMKSRADTITSYQQDDSSMARIHSWEAAIRMIEDHPLTGVGLSSFGVAFPDYSEYHPRMAHDSLLQITAESGVIAGLMYLFIIYEILTGLWKRGNAFRHKDAIYTGNFSNCLNEALLTCFAGFVMCASFLSLGDYEIFYFLCVMAGWLGIMARQEDARSTL